MIREKGKRGKQRNEEAMAGFGCHNESKNARQRQKKNLFGLPIY
jgi:hypothetical protein